VSEGPRALKGIKDVFYETRVAMGREYTVRRFAEEVLGKTIDPVMLGYIEKGKRFPSEALVRRVAAVRKQDAHELLAILWRDRTVHAFKRELDRMLSAPRTVAGIEDGELAVAMSQAMAGLPDEGAWITLAEWREKIREPVNKHRPRSTRASDALVKKVEEAFETRGLAEVKGSKVRKRGRHYVATGAEERRALALEFVALFAKTLIDKLALVQQDPPTYLRNHFLHISPDRLVEFQQRLDDMLRGIAQEFAADPSPDTRFLNVLTSTTTV
jgi:hypothetical protein